MLKRLLITTAAAALLAGSAFSQAPEAPAPQPSSPSAQTATGQPQMVPLQAPDQFLTSKFKGTDVIGSNNEKIGSVSDILFDKDAKILAYVVGVGGFLGSVARYLLSGTVQTLLRSETFPFGTLAVNVLGCFVVGLVSYLADSRGAFTGDRLQCQVKAPPAREWHRPVAHESRGCLRPSRVSSVGIGRSTSSQSVVFTRSGTAHTVPKSGRFGYAKTASGPPFAVPAKPVDGIQSCCLAGLFRPATYVRLVYIFRYRYRS